MKTPIISLVAGALCCLGVQGQGTFIYDQQSADEQTGGGVAGTIQQYQSIVQSFTPSLDSLDFVRLNVADRSVNGIGATLYVNLRKDSLSGTIIAQSAAVSLPDGYSGFPDFIFQNTPLTPGTTYFFEPRVQSGDSWAIVAYTYNYPRGSAYFDGTASFNDLWFREGIIVPEPSAGAILVLAAGVFALRRARCSLDNRSRA